MHQCSNADLLLGEVKLEVLGIHPEQHMMHHLPTCVAKGNKNQEIALRMVAEGC